MVEEVPEEVEVLCHQLPEEVEVLCHPHPEAVPLSVVQPVRLQEELLLLHLADQIPPRPDRKIHLPGIPSMAVPSVLQTVHRAQVPPIKTGLLMIPDKAGIPIVPMLVDLELRQEARLIEIQVWVMETDLEVVEPEAIGPVETDRAEIISTSVTITISTSMRVEIRW